MTDKLPPLPLSIIRTVHGNDDCYTAGQMRKYAAAARAQALEEAARAVESERLLEPQDCDGDRAYESAIGHCLDAIRALKDTP